MWKFSFRSHSRFRFTREVVVVRQNTPEEMEAASDGYCRSCKKLFNREGKKHCVNIFGEKGAIFNPSSSNGDEIARLNEFSELAIFPSEMRNFK